MSENETKAEVTQPEEEITHSELPTGDDPATESVVEDTDTPEQEADEPPEVVGEEPAPEVDPTLLGYMEDNEQKTLIALQRNHQQLVLQLGYSVLRILDTANQVGGTEEQIQNTYKTIAQRLNIGSDVRWMPMGDGSVRSVPTGPQEVPPPAKPEGEKSEV